MSTIPQVGGVDIPTSMRARAESYKFIEQGVEIAGDGTAIAVGPQSLRWKYKVLRINEMVWWTHIALLGAHSRSTTFKLWVNDQRNDVFDFTSGIIYRPRFESMDYYAGFYWGVEIFINHLLPIVPSVLTQPWTVGTTIVGSTDPISY